MLAGLSRLNSKAMWTLGLLFLAIGCGPDATAPSGLGPISLSVVSGNGQSGVVGAELPQPLVIKATDSKGVVQGGLTVNFRVTSGGGSMYAGVASTDSKGIAEDYWTLGTSTAQTERVEVRAVLSSGQKQVYGTFTATPLPGPAAQIAIGAGNQQTAHPASTLPIAPAVKVTDQYGNPVPNVSVTFTPAAGSGTVPSGTPKTDANGIAASSWTLGSTCGGTNTLTGSATGNGIAGNPATFTARAGECWTTEASMPTGTWGAASGVIGARLVLAGGQVANDCTPIQTLEVYDPAANSWTTGPPMPTARWQAAAGVVNGVLYVMGGEVAGCGGVQINTVEAYDPVANTWATKAPMPTARSSFGVAAINGSLYALGGSSGTVTLATLEAYDPVANTWATKAPMPTNRNGLTVGVVNGILYAVGGDNTPGSGLVTTVEAYDPVANTWSTRAPMSTARHSPVSGVVQGMIYVAGGYNSTGDLNTLESFDPAKNVWTTLTPMPTARAFAMSEVVNDIIYVVGGVQQGPTSVAANEAYHP